MRLGIFLTNLNQGYVFGRLFSRLGVSVKVFNTPAILGQESHHWWTDRPRDVECVLTPPIPLDQPGRLTRMAAVRCLYREAEGFDVLLLGEQGPAIFSELTGVPKAVISVGDDLQNYPFQVEQNISWGGVRNFLQANILAAVRGEAGAGSRIIRTSYKTCRSFAGMYRYQQRQRLGLRQATRLFVFPAQQSILRRLGIDPHRAVFLPFPMDTETLAEVDHSLVKQLRQCYEPYDVVFFHPCRHFYVSRPRDPYRKDNYKLLEGFARLVGTTRKRVLLLLIRKGFPADLARSDQLIDSLGIKAAVQWLPEMTNRELRAYYSLPNIAVCDQFSPNLAVLGNVGREATYFGRPLVTAFRPWNRQAYGDDLPEHVFAAETSNEVEHALRQVIALSADEWAHKARSAQAWFARHLSPEAGMPRWLEIVKSCVPGVRALNGQPVMPAPQTAESGTVIYYPGK